MYSYSLLILCECDVCCVEISSCLFLHDVYTSCLFFGCNEKINKCSKLKHTHAEQKLCHLAVLSGFGLTLTLAIAFIAFSTDSYDWRKCSG